MINGLNYSGVPSSPFKFEPPVMLGSGVTVFPNVEIGAHSYMNGGVIRSNVTIGRFCSIAYDITIGIPNHPTHLLSTHPFATKGNMDQSYLSPFLLKKSLNNPKTIVGNDVWISNGVIIIEGVTIGTGAVVGAGAVVTKDIPPYAIVGGIPARVIRYRFDESTILKLLDSKWWLKSIDDLVNLPLNNIHECIERLDSMKSIPQEFVSA